MGSDDLFEEDTPRSVDTDAEAQSRLNALMLDLDGFEGPIDVLLTLSREQKVDLRHISILQLAEQYLHFIATARHHQLELAADYLVMAAWLAYLKSRLLLPEQAKDEEPSGEEMAAALQFQLERLHGMRDAGQKLFERPQLGRDFFARGAPEGVRTVTRSVYDVTLFDLLKAYGDHVNRHAVTSLEIEAQNLYTVDDALKRLREMVGYVPEWTELSMFLPTGLKDALLIRSAVSAHFVASLELAKQGKIDLRQEGGVFSPIFVKGIQ